MVKIHCANDFFFFFHFDLFVIYTVGYNMADSTKLSIAGRQQEELNETVIIKTNNSVPSLGVLEFF